MEQQYWNQWNGHGGEGEGALALLNLSDGSAGKEPTTLSRSNKPMRVDLRDFTKPKKMVTSKLNTKKEKGKMKKQNRFEILGCLLDGIDENDKAPKDVCVLLNTSSRTTSLATSRIPVVSRLLKTTGLDMTIVEELTTHCATCLDDLGAKIEAVMDSETAEPVAPAFQAPWVPMLES